MASIYSDNLMKAFKQDEDAIKRALITAGCDPGAVALLKVNMHGIAHVRADLLVEAFAKLIPVRPAT